MDRAEVLVQFSNCNIINTNLPFLIFSHFYVWSILSILIPMIIVIQQ